MLETRWLQFVQRLRPEIQVLDRAQQLVAGGDVFSVLVYSPLLAASIIWLVAETNTEYLTGNWSLFGLIAGLIFLYDWLPFFYNAEVQRGRFLSFEGSLDGVALWAGYFLFGPVILWIGIAQEVYSLIKRGWISKEDVPGWVLARVFLSNTAARLFSMLAAHHFYTATGGQLPIMDLRWQSFLPAVATIFFSLVVFLLFFSLYVGYITFVRYLTDRNHSAAQTALLLIQASGVLYLAHPFGILGAGIYAQNQQIASFLFFNLGILLVAVIARQLSRVVESTREQSNQMEVLERLSRAILTGSPDTTDLPEILNEHLQNLFVYKSIVIWVEERGCLVCAPDELYKEVPDIWLWVIQNNTAITISSNQPVAWRGNQLSLSSWLIAPIYDYHSNESRTSHAPVGFICVELQQIFQLWTREMLNNQVPIIQTLAAQIASAMHQAKVYAESLDFQRSSDELRIAGEIQNTFFPDELPSLPGWEIAVTILPARETSGDFFDFIPLEDGRLGILIADVTDKGVGPALYMALSRTLIRTYAVEYEADPDVVFFATNDRILKDARANLFVTAFYGILDPVKGEMAYCNAGHNPPYLLRTQNGEIEGLQVTGLPIGFDTDSIWTTNRITIEPGDILLLYTDGIPDAVNEQGEFFDDQRMIDAALDQIGSSALEIQANIIEEVQLFAGNAAQVDDITLIVLTRVPIQESVEMLDQAHGKT